MHGRRSGGGGGWRKPVVINVCECGELGVRGQLAANDDLVCLQDGFPQLTYEELVASPAGKLR